MIKKMAAAFLVGLTVFGFAGCSLAQVPEYGADGGQELIFDEDKMVGAFIVVYDGQTPLTPTDFQDDSALKYYIAEEKYDDLRDETYITSVMGREVFTDASVKMSELDGVDSISIQLNLPFTYELVGALAEVRGVYEDRDDGGYYAEESGNMYTLTDIATTGTTIEQTLTTTLTGSGDQSRSVSYECSISINFALIDNLTAVNVTQFDENNNIISSDTHSYGQDNEYTVSEDCAYVVVEECYEVMHDYKYTSLKYKGMTYCERVLINRPLSQTTLPVMLEYPAGDGFVLNDYLKISFA